MVITVGNLLYPCVTEMYLAITTGRNFLQFGYNSVIIVSTFYWPFNIELFSVIILKTCDCLLAQFLEQK